MDFIRGDENPFADGKVKVADPRIPLEDTWKAMEELVDAGLTKSIGISNFTVDQIKAILAVARIPPAVLQIEAHPYLQQLELLNLCKEHNIIITAYSPLGNPAKSAEYAKQNALNDPLIVSIAQKYGKTPAQVLIRWSIDRGVVVIPKSVSNPRIEENFNVFDFELSQEELNSIAALDRNERVIEFSICKNHPNFPF